MLGSSSTFGSVFIGARARGSAGLGALVALGVEEKGGTCAGGGLGILGLDTGGVAARDCGLDLVAAGTNRGFADTAREVNV